jgi:hypothetical protein
MTAASAVLSGRTLYTRGNSRSATPFLAELLVSDELAPSHGAAGLIGLLHHQVGHEAVRRCAVPVFLAGLEEDAIAGPNLLDWPVTPLAPADALGDVDRLAERVGVPGRAGARRKVHQRRPRTRQPGRCRDGGDVDVARELGPLGVVQRTARDLH